MLHGSQFDHRDLVREMNKLMAAKYRQGVDSREQPLYTVKEAAYYLGINSQTLHTWLFGREYHTVGEPHKRWEPVIVPAEPDLKLLSFYNLAEAHILAATRYEHKVPFWAVREAIATLESRSPVALKHPLLAEDFFTNGQYLFVEKIKEIVNISSQQLPLEIMKSFVVRVLRDEHGPFKIYPLRPNEPQSDRTISIISGVSYSRPVLDDGKIPVMTIWRRFNAGENEEFIAKDFDIGPSLVRRAIEYVERRAA
jgi:uncharacterized protein (DUF433 family)